MKICSSNTEPTAPKYPDVTSGDVVKATCNVRDISHYYLVITLPSGLGNRLVGLGSGDLFQKASLYNSSPRWTFEKVTDKVCLKVEE